MTALFYIAGALTLIGLLAALLLMHDKAMQEVIEESIREEYETRMRRDIARRWRNQDVRIHAQMVIVDEMHREADE